LVAVTADHALLHLGWLCCRRGRALSLKGDYEEAEVDLKHAAELDPSVAAEVTRELAANKQRAKAAEQKQRQQLKSFLNRSQ
jgi:hypothetical protein